MKTLTAALTTLILAIPGVASANWSNPCGRIQCDTVLVHHWMTHCPTGGCDQPILRRHHQREQED